MRKRALAICLCIVLALVSVGATIAYFTDEEKATNTFTVGKVEITLDETDVDNSTKNSDRDTANAYKLIPGSAYIKDPIVHISEGSSDCYVFVKVENGLKNIIGTNDTYKTVEQQIEENGWIKHDPTAGIYVYKGLELENEYIATAEEDLIVFENFMISGDTTKEQLAEFKNKEIIVTAYAIQATGFDTADDAWEALSKQLGL